MTDATHTPGPWRIDETIHKDQPHIISELGSFIAALRKLAMSDPRIAANLGRYITR